MGEKSQDTSHTACLARAIAAELRRMYPSHTTGRVSQDLQCTPKAAENLLAGHLSASSVARVIGAYGAGWVAERVLDAAGLTLENYISNQAAEAEQAANRARERACEARELVTRLQTARSGDIGHDGQDA